MLKVEFNSLELGLYKVEWKTGGYSYAAIGNDRFGNRWIAPINWIEPAMQPGAHIYHDIERVTLIRGKAN